MAMSINGRLLPQWLVDLKNGIASEKNTDIGENSKNSPSKTAKFVNKSQRNNKINGNSKKDSGSSPKKQRGRSRTRQEISSDEEVDSKLDHEELREQGIKSTTTFVDQQEIHLDCVKENNESSDATDFEIDMCAKKENLEDSLCNDEPVNHNTPSDPLVDAKAHIGEDDAASSGNSPVADILGRAECRGTAVCDTVDNSADNRNNSGKEINGNASFITDPNINDSDAVNVSDNDSSSANNTMNNSNQIVRPKCKYGSQCYRKNPQHREDFSHPDDADFTLVDNRPECEYGLSCYRKNPLHRQHYKHTRKMQKPRQAKRPRKKLADVNASEDEEDDYDLDDPFIDDGSSDDYQPSDSDSETDFDGEEAEEDSRKREEEKVTDRKKVLKKEHKRPQKNGDISESDVDNETDDGEEDGGEEEETAEKELGDRKKMLKGLKRKHR